MLYLSQKSANHSLEILIELDGLEAKIEANENVGLFVGGAELEYNSGGVKHRGIIDDELVVLRERLDGDDFVGELVVQEELERRERVDSVLP